MINIILKNVKIFQFGLVNKKAFTFSLQVEKEGDQFHAWCPETGCHSHGKTKFLALENLKDTIQINLDTLMEEEIVRQAQELEDQ